MIHQRSIDSDARGDHTTRRSLIAVLASALVVGSWSLSTAATSGTTSGEASGKLAGVKVPDAFTALTMVPISSPTFPFPGSDGKYHVAYDLQLTNSSRLPATLDRIDVVDARSRDDVVASFSGPQLVEPDCAVGDCNRLRVLPASPAPDNAIAPSESRAVMIDFAFDSLSDAPKAVLHRLVGTGATSPGSREPAPFDILVTPFDISAGKPRVIGPPVKGKNWIALNGCCEPGFPHRTSPNSFSGKINNSQRFAIDWKQTNDAGEFYTGDRTKNASYVDYSSNIYAVADGTIVATLDDVDANAPGVLPANDPTLAPQITVNNVDGNHIVLDIGGGVYAMYAHLIRGSLMVKPGDKVEKGDVIAKLGNTGNSNASHLHFQLMDGPSLIQADGLPYVIDRFTYEGQVSPQLILDADDYLTGTFLQDKLATGELRKKQLPLSLAIVDFPG